MLRAELVVFSHVKAPLELHHYVLRAEVADVAAAQTVWLDQYDARVLFTRLTSRGGERIQIVKLADASPMPTAPAAADQERLAAAFGAELARALRRLGRPRGAPPVVAWEPLRNRTAVHIPTDHLRFLLQCTTPYELVTWSAADDELRQEQEVARVAGPNWPPLPRAVLTGAIESAGTAHSASFKVTLALDTPEEDPFHRTRLWSKTLPWPSASAPTAH